YRCGVARRPRPAVLPLVPDGGDGEKWDVQKEVRADARLTVPCERVPAGRRLPEADGGPRLAIDLGQHATEPVRRRRRPAAQRCRAVRILDAASGRTVAAVCVVPRDAWRRVVVALRQTRTA